MPLSKNELDCKKSSTESMKNSNVKGSTTNQNSPYPSKEEGYLRELSELQEQVSNEEDFKEKDYLRELSLLQEQENGFKNSKSIDQNATSSQSPMIKRKEQDLLLELKSYCKIQEIEWRERQIRYMKRNPHVHINLSEPWDPNAIA